MIRFIRFVWFVRGRSESAKTGNFHFLTPNNPQGEQIGGNWFKSSYYFDSSGTDFGRGHTLQFPLQICDLFLYWNYENIHILALQVYKTVVFLPLNALPGDNSNADLTLHRLSWPLFCQYCPYCNAFVTLFTTVTLPAISYCNALHLVCLDLLSSVHRTFRTVSGYC
jgi:hypothetical protein